MWNGVAGVAGWARLKSSLKPSVRVSSMVCEKYTTDSFLARIRHGMMRRVALCPSSARPSGLPLCSA